MKNRKIATAVVLQDVPDDAHNFKKLPEPTGAYPYRLALERVIGSEIDMLQEKMSFHMLGDTGSLRHSAFQAVVANVLNEQSDRQLYPEDSPTFLYHLGDIVYNHGEAKAYPKQFLKPYERYGAPIFAIAGNHDGDINPESEVSYQSLEAFMDVFCDTERRPIGFGEGSQRQSMIQPNVYWTLETPLARIIGLYPNVLKHGALDEEQRRWFVDELIYAKEMAEEQAIIVCIHHAPYSADTNHGSSVAMVNFLDQAFAEAGVKPDAVFSGHVHNYQRFLRRYADGSQVPFVVAGAGGYVDLHTVADVDDTHVQKLDLPTGSVTLEAYCENRYGFLKLAVQRTVDGLSIIGEYYTLPEQIEDGDKSVKPELFDRFMVPVNRHIVNYP
ncbi:metallophosphoesterase [Sphingobacterium oryzagri]|uniref:Metallophosphoesterase n=1 Tax=Sphingobacterium oryzagri TaxID=3025669 RepID=A0ABY7WFG2_9SPHI|nr:metallophosphoesterase [Sphingobacterium sp. KACC 22765]WDF67271.1 metallophosphoesterase [Sphingobacterium sp. KACC 22765]